MFQQRRSKPTQSLKERLINVVKRLRDEVKTLSPGAECESKLRTARQAETASHIEKWLRSAGLRPPT